MKKNYALLFLLLLASAMVSAQKIDQRLTRLVEHNKARRAKGMMVNPAKTPLGFAASFDQNGAVRSVGVQAYLKQGAECPTEQLEKIGIDVRYVVDNVAVLSVPIDKLSALENIDAILFAKADDLAKIHNDKAREVTQANKLTKKADAAAVGLPQAYTGEGVVIGVIDAGIDFRHRAFQAYDSQSNSYVSRIKRAYIFKSGEGVKESYTTAEQIKELTTDNNRMSHGSHTLAIAAGSDTGNGLQGVAPEAEIVVVGMGNTTSESNISEGIRLISQYADEVQKPCVISISMGVETNLHDGSSLVAKTIKEITQSGTKPGKAVLMSAGNDANHWGGIVKTLGAPGADGYNLKTVLGRQNKKEEEDDTPNYESLDIIIYAADGKDFTAELKLINIKTGEVVDPVGKITDGEYGEPKNKTVALTKNNQANASGGTSVTYKIKDESTTQLVNGDLRLAIFVKGTEGQVIKMIFETEHAVEHSFFVPEALADKGFTGGSNNFNISSYVCDDAVISVGSTVSRTEWDFYKAKDGEKNSLKQSPVTGAKPKLGDVSDFSSFCNADDNGKARPTLVAPGESINSAYNTYDILVFKDGVPYDFFYEDVNMTILPESAQITGPDGKTHWYGALSGTSMACPHAAGIVALWMQANKNLTVNAIKDIMNETCKRLTAEQCPTKEVAQAGYGIIDAVAGLKKILGTTAIETVDADGHRGATPATMYSVDAPVYNLNGQRVDKNHKGLVIYKGRVYMNNPRLRR